MKIIDDKSLDIAASSDYIVDTVGIVVKDSESTGKNTLCLFIPRLMMGLDIKQGAKEEVKTIDNSKIKNSQNKNIGDSTANWQNYIEAPCLQIPNVQLPKYKVGERVYLTFADQDISSIAFLPYSVTDISKRPSDIVDFGVSARGSEDDKLDDDHFYRMRFDSKTDKMIQIMLTKGNGEVDIYHMTFDGKNGKIVFGDSKRQFLMNTNDDMFQMTNEANTVWQMKEGKIKATGDDLEYEFTNSIKFKAPTIEINGDDLKTKMNNSITEECQTKKEKSTSRTTDWVDVVEKGTKVERSFMTDVQKASIYTIEGIAAVGGVGWMAPGGIRPPIPAANIDNVGMANFAFPNPIGMEVARAQPTIQAATFLAAQIDIIYGLFGCPPLSSTMVSSMGSLITSPFLKG